MTTKIFLSAQQLLEDAFRLGAEIVVSGFRPTVMVAIWRGGMPIGVAVQEMLAYAGIPVDHIPVRTSSYQGIDERSDEVRIDGTQYLLDKLRREDRLLIVDDVFDTGRTMAALIDHVQERAGSSAPHDIRVAVPYYKPGRRLTERVPDYHLHETSDWLVYPQSLEGLSEDEIADHRPELYRIIRDHLPG